ncbi:alpha-L-fucosidase [Segetibacter sp. 3557_3]|uniref:alpha-L-fucosidase n=1 Tax=Segetibacter sp. 3557_3 TaxID=2547429 RepID=UPI001058DA6F|nr:alpha-L-fucosidase [Segetibacter sp. 3557_3]TDH28613.1 alpha-L-fucosidase [Segetibacter sp. 3557_3]
MIRTVILFVFLFFVFDVCLVAQESIHPQSTAYEWPTDPQVRNKLEQWRDLKFGMIIHWGLYAVPGIIESWSICSEDWIERDSNSNYDEYKNWYWGLKKDFNPINFDPTQWAAAGKDAGMKYLVFTTKHHDGFCMFDTKQTDFKISNGPFASHPKANVAKAVFDAFREKDFMIGAYFSKPDWHSENYWWPKYATPDRNNNYDITRFPWRWNAFKQYTYNQLSELMHDYGSVDILWLDGGWVRPRETVNAEVLSWGAPIPKWSQDIDMPRIAAMGRKAQPGLLIVDRTVHGPYENYQTPEQRIPEKQLDYPWESCMTLADNWGFVPNDRFKSPAKIIHTLIDVVAKGGSLLLGIGPKPDGTLPPEAITRMAEIGTWLKRNGAAIYNTRTVKDYKQDSTYFTGGEKSGKRYALVCLKQNELLTTTITWNNNLPKQGTTIKLLQSGETIKWSTQGNQVKLTMPVSLVKSKEQYPALAFEFTPAE